MSDLLQTFTRMNAQCEALTKFYCFDPKKYDMETFFGDLNKFKEQYEVP
jgi:hypothetical protein